MTRLDIERPAGWCACPRLGAFLRPAHVWGCPNHPDPRRRTVPMCSTCGVMNPDHPDDHRCPSANHGSRTPTMPTIDDQINEARLREARAHADLAELRLQQERMQATAANASDVPQSLSPSCLCAVCGRETQGDISTTTLPVTVPGDDSTYSVQYGLRLHLRCFNGLSRAMHSLSQWVAG